MIKIIAEIGINHCGRIADALRLISHARDAGADIAKFQIYHTANLVRNVSNYDLLRSCELADGDHRCIKAYCDSIGIEWMASCFDRDAVDLAVDLGAKTIKVGSGELVNHELIKHIGRNKRDLLLSTGMADEGEIRAAINAYDDAHPDYGELSLLHCVSSYPVPIDQVNLNAIKSLRSFCCPVGFSDHTKGFDAAVVAVALGARIIERHIMLEPGCPDEAVSLSPENFRGYVAAIRRTEQTLGDGVKRCMPCEEQTKKNARYRWHVSTDSKARSQGVQLGERSEA